jgi:actin-like ATPase involved in cell morphogenesis
MLQGLDRALREATGIPVILAEDPMAVVVTGSARAMETRQEVEVTGMLRLSAI